MKFVKVFLIICVFWSCQNIKEIKKPDNLIPEDEMVEVLTELNLLNSAKNYNKRLLEKTGMQPDKYLYNKYDIDSLQLAESTTYYAKKYDKFDGIYQKVKQNLEAMKAKLIVIRDEEQRIEDSIRALDTLNLDSLQTPKPVLIDSLDLQILKEGVY
jgi:acyl carrier protein